MRIFDNSDSLGQHINIFFSKIVFNDFKCEKILSKMLILITIRENECLP